MNSNIRILHLSDLHFYEGSDGNLHHHRHSLDCMKKLERFLDNEKPDVLIVTGDLTNIGDSNNLDRVYQWIHDRINVRAEYYGLKAQERDCEIIIVPGNHDAFNAPSTGSNWKRWQTALSNYYDSFPEYLLGDKGVAYRWIQKGNTKLFVTTVDSTYLGDPETKDLAHTLSLSRVAKGKISQIQCSEILDLHDQGLAGNLRDAQGNRISRSSFASSIKILVMHHYLFEPSGAKATPLLHMKQKRTVFQNLAMADFDALVCGHKHICDFSNFVYLDHFEPRGKIRYALNHIRRILGIKSLPLNTTETQGRSVRKGWKFLLSILYLNHVDEHGLSDDVAQGVISILKKGIQDRRIVKDEVIEYLTKQRSGRAAGLFERDEILNLHRLIMKQFRKEEEQKNLWDLADSIKPLLAKLASRPFAHVVAGSASKSCETGSRERSFNIYDIKTDFEESKHSLTVRRYSWDNASVSGGDWANLPIKEAVDIPFDRHSWEVIEKNVEQVYAGPTSEPARCATPDESDA